MKNQRSSRAKQWDRKARAFGFRDERDWRHQLRVRRLRELLRRMPIRPDSYMFRSIIAIKGYLPAHPDLFTVREVADAIGASAKVIRKAARGGMIKFRRLPGQNARKLFFELAAVRQFKDRFRPGDNLRSEKIALNPHFRQGDAVTIDRAMVELGLSRRGVQYYLSQGVLKKIPCGHRTVLITKKSLAGLSWRRLAQPERQFNAAKKEVGKNHPLLAHVKKVKKSAWRGMWLNEAQTRPSFFIFSQKLGSFAPHSHSLHEYENR